MPYVDSYRFGAGGRLLYWVGGTGTWNSSSASHWSLYSGGPGGEPVPTSVDDVIFDINSGGGTVTLSSQSVCKNAIFQYSVIIDGVEYDFGYNGILSQPNVTWSIYGSLYLSPSMTYTLGALINFTVIDFLASGTTNYIITSGQIMPSELYNGAGSTWYFQDDHESQGHIEIDSGTLNTNGKTVICIDVEGQGSTTRGVIIDDSTIYVYGTSQDAGWEFTTVTNLTFSSSNSTIIMEENSLSTANKFRGGGLTYEDVNIIMSPAPDGINVTEITGANTFENLSIVSNFDTGFCDIDIFANQVINDTFTITGYTASLRTMLRSDTFGTQRTITATNFNFSNVDFRDINAGIAWDLSSIPGRSGDAFGNTNITFSTPRNVYWYRNTGDLVSETQWFLGSGGTGGAATCPIPQDTGIFDSNSFSIAAQTILIQDNNGAVRQPFGSLDFSAATNNAEMRHEVVTCYGSLTLGAGMTVTAFPGTGNLTFAGRGNFTFKSNGVTWTSNLVGGWLVDSLTGTLTIQDNFTTQESISVVSGTLDFGNNSITVTNNITLDGGTLVSGSGAVQCAAFVSTNNVSRILNMGSGTWTLTGTGTVWNVTNTGTLTFDAETSTISCTNTSASTKTFAGAGLTYYNLAISGAASAGTLTITGSNTFNNTTFAANSNIRLTAATTQTINGTCAATGTAGNTITVNSTSATNATISSSNNVTWDYCTLTDLTGTGGGTFTATNSTDGGGNVNWTITP